MGTSRPTSTQVVMERVASEAAATDEWWSALSFDDNVALEPDPMLTSADETVDVIELRLYSV
ncbi:MAG: hypothetical protein M3010_08540 [Candidatus Dormibacteraeota bacterium]|nr:hypothetical protein [Candidatus Dormibacteraeota bacterium]